MPKLKKYDYCVMTYFKEEKLWRAQLYKMYEVIAQAFDKDEEKALEKAEEQLK